MESPAKSRNLRELQTMIAKFTLELCCYLVTPEFGIPWHGVTAALRKSRLPMTPGSIASVLTKYAAKRLTDEELQDVITRLRLTSIVFHPRTWHVLELTDKARDEPINFLISSLASRIKAALKRVAGPHKQYQVHTMKLQDLMVISVQLVTNGRQGSTLYVASPLGHPVALVSSLHSNMTRACVYGLGYSQFKDAFIKGKDISSLLCQSGVDARTLEDMPDELADYTDSQVPAPRHRKHQNNTVTTRKTTTQQGHNSKNDNTTVSQFKKRHQNNVTTQKTIAQQCHNSKNDNTIVSLGYKQFEDAYIKGKDIPSLLRHSGVDAASTTPTRRLPKQMKIVLDIKSENTLYTLQKWAELRAIQPTSELFSVYHTVRSNQIQISPPDDE